MALLHYRVPLDTVNTHLKIKMSTAFKDIVQICTRQVFTINKDPGHLKMAILHFKEEEEKKEEKK